MYTQFLGAAEEVTGSKHLLKTENGNQILLDCGMFQGGQSAEEEYWKNEHLGFHPGNLDCVVLSHAHIDHSGLIPRLIKEGFEGPVYTTPPTKDLYRVMLEDSAHIQEKDVKDLNKQREKNDEKLLKPLYGEEDVHKSIEHFITLPYGRDIEIVDGVQLNFTDAGHILGSAAVNLTIQESGGGTIQLTYTGDIGRPGDKILQPPEAFPQADVILMESTYGNRSHAKQENPEAKLKDVIWDACHESHGKLIIPAFSLDRTQDIVFMLDKMHRNRELPDIKFFVDSPLANRVTEIMREHTSYFNEEILNYMRKDPHPFQFDNLHYTKGVEDSRALNDLKEPAVIISASGMMEGGRIQHHLIHHIEDPDTTLLLVGYSTSNSLGGKIQNGAAYVHIFGQPFQVKANVVAIDGFSAHADYEEILDYMSCQDPRQVGKVFLVHGEPDALASMEEKVRKQDFRDTTIPAQGSEYHISKKDGRLVVQPTGNVEVS